MTGPLELKYTIFKQVKIGYKTRIVNGNLFLLKQMSVFWRSSKRWRKKFSYHFLSIKCDGALYDPELESEMSELLSDASSTSLYLEVWRIESI